MLIFFAIQMFSVTFLQKLAVNIDLSSIVNSQIGGLTSVCLLIFYLSFIPLLFIVNVKADIVKLSLFLFLCVALFISVAFQPATFSLNSIGLLIALYAPFIFNIEISSRTWTSMLYFYQNIIVIVCFLLLIEHLWQLTFGASSLPNMDRIVGENSILYGYNYIQPIKSGSQLVKPNAFFFREVSFLSQWIAIAFAIELLYFQRLWRLALYSFCLLATFAGTGILLVCLSLPFLLMKLRRRTAVALLLLIPLLLYGMTQINWLGLVQSRTSEYNRANSSSYERFIAPADILRDKLFVPANFFTGQGPGSGQKSEYAFWWPSTKIMYEYGALSLIAFYAYIIYCCFSRPPSRRLAFLLFIQFNIMGELIVPVGPILFLVMTSLFHLRSSSTEISPVHGKLLANLTNFFTTVKQLRKKPGIEKLQ